MRKWLRRIRGALGMGFTWAPAWFAVGFVPRWLFGVSTDLPLPLLFGALGFIGGVTFSGVLVLTEGRRRFDQLSLPHVAGWGAIGGVLLSALAGVRCWRSAPPSPLLPPFPPLVRSFWPGER